MGDLISTTSVNNGTRAPARGELIRRPKGAAVKQHVLAQSTTHAGCLPVRRWQQQQWQIPTGSLFGGTGPGSY